jgi:hypothetical protein
MVSALTRTTRVSKFIALFLPDEIRTSGLPVIWDHLRTNFAA